MWDRRKRRTVGKGDAFPPVRVEGAWPAVVDQQSFQLKCGSPAPGESDMWWSQSGCPKWVPFERDDSALLTFIADRVLSVLELPNQPEPTPDCEWCLYRDAVGHADAFTMAAVEATWYDSLLRLDACINWRLGGRAKDGTFYGAGFFRNLDAEGACVGTRVSPD